MNERDHQVDWDSERNVWYFFEHATGKVFEYYCYYQKFVEFSSTIPHAAYPGTHDKLDLAELPSTSL